MRHTPVSLAFSSLLLLLLLATLRSGEAAEVAELIKNLASRDNEIRRAAAQELSELGKDAKPALPALTKSLADEDRFVRRFAAQAVGNIGPDAKDSINALAALLQDREAPVRKAAVQALARMGPSAIPTLTRALSGTASDVQEGAITALGKAGAPGVPGLVGVIKNTKAEVGIRRRAIDAVVPLGKAAEQQAVPVLVDTVKNPGGRGGEVRQLRIDAINGLGRLARASNRAAVDLLDGMVKDEKLKDNQVKNAARAALKRIRARK